MHRYTINIDRETGYFTDIEFETFLDVLNRADLPRVLSYCRNYIIPDVFSCPYPKDREEAEKVEKYLADFSELFQYLQTEEVGISHSTTMICMKEYLSEKGCHRYKVSLGQLDPEKALPDLDEVGYETEWELNGYAIDPEVTDNLDISDEAVCAEVLAEVLKAREYMEK
ncbi:MAG: hypothetical protein SOW34_13570 [Oliverpabstia sp.]|nr:hypothetical protein [Oliverpabstia sp.]